MLGRSILAGAFVVAISAPALAFHCPADVKAIDAGLAKSSAMADTKSKVMSLRNEGEALHKAGKHKESVDKLAAAMRLLLTGT